MNESDLIRLRHMLAYAREIVQFTTGRTRQDLDTDLLLVRALTYSTGVIGEAAANISREFQDAHPQIPWPQIIGMRNRLFHGYFEINLDRLWDTAVEAIPPLVADLEKLIPPEDKSE